MTMQDVDDEEMADHATQTLTKNRGAPPIARPVAPPGGYNAEHDVPFVTERLPRSLSGATRPAPQCSRARARAQLAGSEVAAGSSESTAPVPPLPEVPPARPETPPWARTLKERAESRWRDFESSRRRSAAPMLAARFVTAAAVLPAQRQPPPPPVPRTTVPSDTEPTDAEAQRSE